jgi:hypothetical protein
MKKLCILTLFMLTAFAATMAQAAPLPKVTICHIPPGNPENAHTITISENALAAHINNHGDILGACTPTCEAICDDGNACQSDCSLEDGQCEYEPVDCSDSLLCTVDSCDEETGCLNLPVDCDDGEECTTDLCSEFDDGACLHAPVDDGTPCEFGFCTGGVCLSQ